MVENAAPAKPSVKLYKPAPAGFDPFAAKPTDFRRLGLPERPDVRSQPGMAALWERQAARYREFEHVQPKRSASTTEIAPPPAGAFFGLSDVASCGYTRTSLGAPFTALFVTWTIPHLHYSASPLGSNEFRTFIGLGFLDVHVEMTVDASDNVTAHLWAQAVGNVGLAVHPGDVMSVAMCLDTSPAGVAHYFFANETTQQTMNFAVKTGFPPAVTINAGVSRGPFTNGPDPALARFGVVYFDEINAYTTSGQMDLLDGEATTMTRWNSSMALARPYRLNNWAFKAVFVHA